MENHPDWKRQKEIDMDVQQAADAAKKALCLNPDGTNIPDCTPQISQTSSPNQQLESNSIQNPQIINTNNKNPSIVNNNQQA